jgi:methanogenic corrinoid protein MtbC1
VTVRQLLSRNGHGISLETLETLFVPVLERIGLGWEEGRVSLAQVYMSGRLCEEVIDGLPVPTNGAGEPELDPIAVAVFEDSHLLGQRIVYSALRVAGYSVRKYGSISLEPLVKRVIEEGIKVLLVSVLMLPAALRVKLLVERLREVSPETIVIVGGAPFRFDDHLWREVGAHAHGVAASDAVRIVRKLMGGMAR